MPHLAAVELARLDRVWLPNVGERCSKVDHELIVAAVNRWPQIVPVSHDRSSPSSSSEELRDRGTSDVSEDVPVGQVVG